VVFPAVRELLADAIHQIWSNWWKHVLTVSITQADGSVLIPAVTVTRWTRQMEEPYAMLYELEKGSDRIAADKIIAAAFGDPANAAGNPDSVSLQLHHDFYVARWEEGRLEEVDLPQLFLAIWREQQCLVRPFVDI
jgi:hypothetical protein